eukprot:2503329-Alexandrium_andersonii.AAC.1
MADCAKQAPPDAQETARECCPKHCCVRRLPYIKRWLGVEPVECVAAPWAHRGLEALLRALAAVH